MKKEYLNLTENVALKHIQTGDRNLKDYYFLVEYNTYTEGDREVTRTKELFISEVVYNELKELAQ